MNKHVEKLKGYSEFIADCEKDLGRHTVINMLTESEQESSAESADQLNDLLSLVNSENERFLKFIMKVCFCSKSGAEHILDELVDDLSEKNPDSYFVEKAGLFPLLEKEGFSKEDID